MTWAEGQRHAEKRRKKAEAAALLGEVVLRVSRGIVDGEPGIRIQQESHGKLRLEQVAEVLRIMAARAQERVLAERSSATPAPAADVSEQAAPEGR
jgi:hypothetical protein